MRVAVAQGSEAMGEPLSDVLAAPPGAQRRTGLPLARERALLDELPGRAR